MRISQILWDEVSVYHIAGHGITPAEVEEAVFEGNSLILKGREGRYILLSQTLAGRYLTIVVAFKLKGRVKVITARGMDEKERKYYQRGGK
ncbi:MAG: BrnT family toxin [Nitrospirae bacterium]|nr:BrnT family toxin [Nitrospirota bacterium]